jgi:peptide/nickel transport system substrate-binding protein
VRSPGLAGFASLALFALACDRGPSTAPPPPNRTVRVAVPAGLLSLDVHAPEHEEFALSILRNVYEPLVELGDDFGPRPVLAESWHSPDDHTWVFRLKADLRLHDGRVLDAAMVAAAMNRHLAQPWGVNLLQPVEKVEAEGARDVVFRTRGVFLSLPERLATFFVDGDGDAAGRAVGTGRYRVAYWRPDGRVALEAFASHRDGLPAVARVEFLPAADGAERVRLLRKGEAHLALDVPPDAMVQLAGEGFATQSRPGLRVVFLGLNVAPGSPFHDRRVREAVSRGIDRARLVAGALRGFGEPTLQLPADGQMGHDRSLAVPPGDAKGARALLAAAGFRPTRLPLDYVPGKYLEIETVVRAVAAQLAEAGFDVAPRPRRYLELLQDIEAGRAHFYVLGFLDDSRAADSAYATLLHTPGPRFGSVNGSRYSNPRLDELIELAEVEEDAPHRGEMLREATRIVTEDWPLVPLYRQSDLYAHDRKLGFRPRLDRRVRAWDLALLP